MSRINDLIQKRGGIDDLARDILHGSSFLMADIESCLNPGRGKRVAEHGGIQLMFQESGIDDTMWLMSKVWGQIRDLHELLAELRVYVEDHDDKIEKALPQEVSHV